MSMTSAVRKSLSRASHPRLLLLAVAALVLGAALAFALLRDSDSRQEQVGNSRPAPQQSRVGDSEPASQGGQPAAPPGDPYGIGGQEVSLAQAQTTATFPVILPSTDLASPSQLTGLWVATYTSDDSQVALEFDEGSLTILENPLANPKPEAILGRYEDVAARMNETIGRTVFSIVTLDGAPVLVAEPNADAYKSNPASVEVAIGELDLVLASHTYSVEQLLGVAESILKSAG